MITFTEQEYATFDKACAVLDELINGSEGYRAALSEIVSETVDLDDFYDTFATITNYVEEHRE
jgi:hypothetical protein